MYCCALQPLSSLGEGCISSEDDSDLYYAQNKAYHANTARSLSLTHTHRRLRLITLKRVNEKRGREENTSIAAWKCLVECLSVCVCAFTHLLSRQQIHSADGAEFGDVCTATIFPGGVTVCAAMLPEEASRLSVVVNECALRLRPLPAPLLRAASHNYRLMLLPLLLLPSSWHADDLCQGALMGFL